MFEGYNLEQLRYVLRMEPARDGQAKTMTISKKKMIAELLDF